mgnify:CR=1 FL=1
MNLVLVESSIKAKTVNEHLCSLNMDDSHRCSFTSGRIFDFAMNDEHSWRVKNKQVVQYLESAIANAESIIALTDADDQGEYIAYQIAILADKYQKPVVKGDLVELTPVGIKNALNNTRDLDIKTVQKTHSERLVHLKIGQVGVNKGYGPTSIQELMTAEYLANSEMLEVTQDLVSGCPRWYLSDRESASQVVEVPIKPPSTFDLYVNALIDPATDLLTLEEEMQTLYENGLLSYSRTPANEWLPEAIDMVSDLVDSNGYIADKAHLASHTNVNVPHSAIYIVRPNSIGLRLSSLDLINEWTLASAGVSGSRAFKSNIPYPILNIHQGIAGGRFRAQPQLQTLVALREMNLYKPSTSAKISHKLAQKFFAYNARSMGSIKLSQAFASKELPDLKHYVSKRLNPLNELINSEITPSNLEVNPSIANKAFEELTHRGR